MKPLYGQTAIISGGSRGIGAAVAMKLAAAGAAVAVGYHRSRSAAEEVAGACTALGARVGTYRVDVTSREQVEAWVRRVEADLGSPSLLVHSAGVAGNSWLFQDVTDAEYDRVMDTHVRGAFHLIQSCADALIRNRHGRVILISSIWGESGGAGEVLYSAAKGALNAMARALAKEWAPSGITVNAVAPGAIETDMLNQQLNDAEKRDLAEKIPAGRIGKPEEVADLVAYLCRAEAAYLTGQVLHVNGGWYP